MTDAAADCIMPLRQWAMEYMGWKSAGQAYRALKTGRLVLPEGGDGSSVLAEASRRRYEQTAHPAFRRRGAAPAPDAPHDATAAQPPEQGALDFGSGGSYQEFRAHKEKFSALMEEANYRRTIGELVPVAEARSAAAGAIAILRARLEALPVVLPPELAGKDEAQQRATIAEHIEAALRAASLALEKFSTQWGVRGDG